MKLAVPVILGGFLLSCSGSQPQHMSETTPSTPPELSCGAIIDVAHGNAELLLFNDLARFKKQKKEPPFQPQISVWEPSIWTPGMTLRVRFLDGDAATREFVMDVAQEWVAGLKLGVATSSDTDAEVRVTFSGKGVWSKVGKSAQSVPHAQPTMGLAGLLQSNEAGVRRAYVLHEFGHALGALHEHQRRDAPLTWKRDVVYAYYLQLYGWSSTQVDEQVILPFQHQSVASSPNFDRMSVMMYPVHKEFTDEQFVQSWNSQLTSWDRSVMAGLYK